MAERQGLHPRPKAKFTPGEDERLRMMVEQLGPTDWLAISHAMPNRDARQCRERWMNYVNPVLLHVPWTPDEEHLLKEKFREYGAQWQVIALFFPTRSRNQIKHHWQSRPKGKLAQRTVPAPARESDPISRELCEIPMPNPVLCNEGFSEPQQESIFWGDSFEGVF
jgi:hypothetical protein